MRGCEVKSIILIVITFVFLNFQSSRANVNGNAYLQETILPAPSSSNPGSVSDIAAPSTSGMHFETNTTGGWLMPNGPFFGGTIKYVTSSASAPSSAGRNDALEYSSKLFLIGPTIGFVMKGFTGFFTWFPFGSYSSKNLYGTNPVLIDVAATYVLSSAFQLSFGYGFEVLPKFRIGPQILLDWQSYKSNSTVYNKGGTSNYDTTYKTNKRDFSMLPEISFAYAF